METTKPTESTAPAPKAVAVPETPDAFETVEAPAAESSLATAEVPGVAETQTPEVTAPAPKAQFFVYMLRCRDGSLYTGQTNDLEARLRQHTEGTGAKYVRGRRPVELVYVEEAGSRSEALKREYALRKQKELLVSQSLHEV